MRWSSCIIIFLLVPVAVMASEKYSIKGLVLDKNNQLLEGATVVIENSPLATLTKKDGSYVLKNIPKGEHQLICFAYNKQALEISINVSQDSLFNFTLQDLSTELDPVIIEVERKNYFGNYALKAVDGFGIYEAKKSEVIVLDQLNANLATNNSRQIYAKITGLNIWESDGAGLQLGIGGRGLSPNRTANFNVRQNGYDISADALGYPESYYTPPAEAIEKIEIVRGAGALQYGTQFGGMVNFKFKEGPKDKKLAWVSRASVGSWNFVNIFNSAGGTLAKGKLNYYTYFQYKQGDGFRPNSGFNATNFFMNLNYSVNEKLSFNLDYTKMYYLAQQAGGLTDRQFEEDIQQSFRNRNWFEVDWNLYALTATYNFSKDLKINTRNFALVAKRNSLGNLERIHIADFGENRTFINGEFENMGNETRLIQHYKLIGNQKHVFLTGFRLYTGLTTAKQGDGNDGDGADFFYLNPNNLENSDYRFPNQNYSAFVENIFYLSPKFTLTPGIRYEYIKTQAEGYYKQQVFDGAGNLIVDNKIDESTERNRDFVLLGLGSSYKLNFNHELYFNFTQNYRAINFSDLRIANPNFIVDENIQDESGYSMDLGIKGKHKKVWRYELTLFMLKYNNKIGQILRADLPPLYNDYRFRGNISDARNYGVEVFQEWNILSIFPETKTQEYQWNVFTNFAYVNARYINTQDNAIKNNLVEMVPPVIFRAGMQFKYKGFGLSVQNSYTHEHFSDASNAVRTATAVEGLIPTYNVMDVSVVYEYKHWQLNGSVNNVLNEKYFTRRAEFYPGPGIIPADIRSFFLTLQYQL